MSVYTRLLASLEASPRTWLVTGAAGFIGSNLVETLLRAGQKVRGLDNFCTGYQKNLVMIQTAVTPEQWKNFSFTKGDIRDLAICQEVTQGVDYVLHEAAIGSVPRSIDDPIFTNENNISGFLNMLVASRDNKVQRFVYAASSSTYGDEPTLPKQEDRIGKPLSPYAVTKYVNELYAGVFADTYGMNTMGLRYFNIFGQRQDPEGAYAAVIPQWFAGILSGEDVFINGDGETSRDFCFIDNCVQANILAACTETPEAQNKVYNVAVGQRTTLNELFTLIREEVIRHRAASASVKAVHRDFRTGDVRHSLADISLAKRLLGFEPEYDVREGLQRSGDWYAANI